MNRRPALTELSAFAAIAARGSFRKAADELGLSPSTLSHLMRTLEAGMGVRLLHRTTRSVSTTEAGQRLLGGLQPVLEDLDRALSEVQDINASPSGTLRINAVEISARLLLPAVVPAFLTRYPDMSLDLVTEGRLVDIVAEGFDAGIRLAEAVPQDMIAVPFGGDMRFVTVAAPGYLARHKPPRTPQDLKRHACIRFRLPSGKPYRWEFSRRDQEVTIDVPGVLTLDHLGLMAEAAVDGLGIAYVSIHSAAPYLARGELAIVLDDWCPTLPGLCLYYPGHRLVPAGLRAFIEVLRELGQATSRISARSPTKSSKPCARAASSGSRSR